MISPKASPFGLTSCILLEKALLKREYGIMHHNERVWRRKMYVVFGGGIPAESVAKPRGGALWEQGIRVDTTE